MNHLKQIALAAHNYHSTNLRFPDDYYESVFVSILPYMEQENQVEYEVIDPSSTHPQLGHIVAAYLCPSRRVARVGPKTDYCGAFDPTFFDGQTGDCHKSVFYRGTWHKPPVNKVLFTGDRVTLSRVSAGDGSSNTFMLAHKAISVQNYEKRVISLLSGSQDGGWAFPAAADPWLYPFKHVWGWNYDHHRHGGGFANDPEDDTGDARLRALGAWHIKVQMTSPHPSTMPVVLIDGSVRNVGFGIDRDTCWFSWFFNDGVVTELTEF